MLDIIHSFNVRTTCGEVMVGVGQPRVLSATADSVLVGFVVAPGAGLLAQLRPTRYRSWF
jgi:hypothetical protein